MGLSNFQLVLLDNLIYLDTIIMRGLDTIGEVINALLYANGDPGNPVGTGTIQLDCHNTYQGIDSDNCKMNIDDWIKVLKAIEADPVLCSLKITEVGNDRDNGFRALVLQGDACDENVIIFKGTTSAYEWIDNGIGGYSVETENQRRALEFVENLDIVNNKSFVVSGHSKGGNLAQYVTLHAKNTLIDRCLNFDGQGFSEEACATEEYQNALARRQGNIYLVASACDFVNILFNSTIPDEHKMYLTANYVGINATGYHRPDNVFSVDENGNINGLNGWRSISATSYFIQEYINFIMKHASAEEKKEVFDSLMGFLAADAESGDEIVGWTSDLIIRVFAEYSMKAIFPEYVKHFEFFDEKVNEFLQEEKEDYYLGELVELVDSNTVTILLYYLSLYATNTTDGLMSCIAMVDELSNARVFEPVVEAGTILYDAYTYGIWSVIRDAMEDLCDYTLEDFYKNLPGANTYSNTLSEGTKGVGFFKVNDLGGITHMGTGSANSLTGGGGDDYLHGGNGRDTVSGGAGDDVIFGGRGNDNLYGNDGNDVYVIERYDGIDRIHNGNDGKELNFIFFISGINENDVEYEKMGDNLCIKYNSTYRSECRVIVENFFQVGSDGELTNAVDAIMFESGGMLDISDIFKEVGYVGDTGKSMVEKLRDMTDEERMRIFEKYDFLKVQYEAEYGDLDREDNVDEEEDSSTNDSIYEEITGEEGEVDSDDSGEEAEKKKRHEANEAAKVITENIRNTVNDAEEDLLGREPETFHEAEVNTYSDPIIIDLNEDGLFTTSLAEGTYFDFNGDGFAEKTAWMSAGDALLVRDVDGNGFIESGAELFGDQTMLSDGSVATSGFEALSDLDENGDGILDIKDGKYSDLKLWMDHNNDGVSTEEELYALQEFGIISIDLAHNIVNRLDANGNIIKAEGTLSGLCNSLSINEFGFAIDYVDTLYRGDDIDISGLEDGLPELKGCGTLLDLSKAMVLDEQLKQLVRDYLDEDNFAKKQELLKGITYRWAGVDALDAKSRGGFVDARSLAFLEKVYGRAFVGVGGSNPISGAGEILTQLYNTLLEQIQTQLLVQSIYKDALQCAEITHNEEIDAYECNFEEMFALMEAYPQYYIHYFTNFLLNNTELGQHFDKESIATQVDSTSHLWAGYVRAERLVFGTESSDTIYGTDENELFIGDLGNDALNGGYGDDVYVFNIGDGQDTINESYGVDRIVFGTGIKAEDIRVTRDSSDLYLTNLTTGDQIRIRSHYYYNGCQIESVEFEDGTIWDYDKLVDLSRYYYGTESDDYMGSNTNSIYGDYGTIYMYGGAGNDTLYANSGDDKLYGEDGNDTLNGNDGNDTLAGGTGNDALNGGYGDDVYVFNIGDGQDTINESHGVDRIVFGAGIKVEDIRVTRDSSDLYLTNLTTGDQIRIRSHYYYNGCQIESVEFEDGTIWDYDKLVDISRYYYGTEADDYMGSNINSIYGEYGSIYMYGGEGSDTLHANNGDDELYGEAGIDVLNGNNGNDVLVGGIGNDGLNGGYGDDTYVFNIGDGQDTINETQGVDRIVFGAGIKVEDIRVTRDSSDLYLTNLTTGDQIRIRSHYYYNGYQIESVEFEDGTIWDYDKLVDLSRYYYGTEADDYMGSNINSIYGEYGSIYMYGGEGSDTLHANNGDDELYGEAGIDVLNGNNGNDVLVGGIGNDGLNGGYGDDTYVFNVGDGQDTINETQGVDRIVFGEGIKVEDIRVTRNSSDLYLTNLVTGDKITVRNHYYYNGSQIESVEFEDGTIWDYDKLVDLSRYYYGTEASEEIGSNINSIEGDYGTIYMYGGEGSDRLHANVGDDELYGESGNDTLYGNSGNDLMVGGTGNDALDGGYGDDTYVFNIGDGQDTIYETEGSDQIVFGEGIRAQNLMFEQSGSSLKISILGQDDTITISNYFAYDYKKVESFCTEDGSVIDYTKLSLMIQAMASFEDSTGMMWEDAIESNNEQANDIVKQWWTKEAI